MKKKPTMTDKRNKVLKFSAVTLVIGVIGGFGIKLQRAHWQKQRSLHIDAKNLRVLALKGLFTAELVTNLERKTAVRLELTEAVSPEALWATLDAPGAGLKYDLVTIMSYQLAPAVKSARLQELSFANLDENLISPDFRDLPGAPPPRSEMKYFLPLLWGVTGFVYNGADFTNAPRSWKELLSQNQLKGRIELLNEPSHLFSWLRPPEVKPNQTLAQALIPLLKTTLRNTKISPEPFKALSFTDTAAKQRVVEMNLAETAFLKPNSQTASANPWKFVYPEEKATFWILGFSSLKESKRTHEAALFFDFLTNPDTAAAWSEATHQASTLVSQNSRKVDPRLKPSSLRDLPLTKIHVLGADSNFTGHLPAGEVEEFTGANAVFSALLESDGARQTKSETATQNSDAGADENEQSPSEQ